MSRARSSLVITVAIGLLLVGCGNDTKKNAKESSVTTQSTQPPTSTEAPGPAPTSTEPSEPVSSIDLPTLADATYSTGRIHLEMSGDASDAFESDGSGQTTGGVTSAAFPLNQDRLVSIAFGGEGDAAMSVTAAGVSTTVSFGKDCDLQFTEHDGSRIAATFDCPTVQAIDTSTTVKTVSITGNFWLAT